MKLVLFLSAWAVVALMGILLIYKLSGLNTFDILVLREHAIDEHSGVGTTLTFIWVLIFFGFASIAPLWPLHSWSPVGHAAAPAATSMLHAGVLMKLGHFSIIRVAFEILPDTTRELMPIAAVLVHLQHHLWWIRRVLCQGYQVRDRIFQLEPHGLCLSRHGGAELHWLERSGDLYVCACDGDGHVVRHGGLGLRPDAHARHSVAGWARNRMPFVAGCFIIACMASVGMPGTVNFIAEVMIIVGTWNKYPFQVIVAVIGIVLTMAYLFRMMRGIFYGPTDRGV